jgi:hypothetical protein
MTNEECINYTFTPATKSEIDNLYELKPEIIKMFKRKKKLNFYLF